MRIYMWSIFLFSWPYFNDCYKIEMIFPFSAIQYFFVCFKNRQSFQCLTEECLLVSKAVQMTFSIFPWEYFFEKFIALVWCCWLCIPLISASTVNLASTADFDSDPSSQPQCQWKFTLFSLPFLLPKGTLTLGTCSLHLLSSPYFCLLPLACSVKVKPQLSSYHGFLQSP